MKLVKIFGMVLALHVVLLTIFFLSPGCQSTPKTPLLAESQAEPTPVSQVEAIDENWSSQGNAQFGSGTYRLGTATTTPAVASDAPITGLTPAERARTAPSRPSDPSEFIGSGIGAPPPVASRTVPAPAREAINYTVVGGDSFWRISRKFGVTIAELQKANPGVRSSDLKPGDVIKVPGGAPAPVTASAAGAASAAAGQQGTAASAESASYVVRSGDSLSLIAARNGTTVAALRAANHLTSDVIQIGQKLVIPGGEAVTPSASSVPSPSGFSVVIQPGETLGEIARRFDVSVSDLMRANNISDPRRVRAGQTLVIPGFQPVEGGPITLPQTDAVPPGQPREGTPAPSPPTSGANPPQRSSTPMDLDQLIPEDAPVVPIDEPVPAP